MSDLERQPPFKDKKKLLWFLLIPVILIIPNYLTNVIEEATGMTESKFIELMSPEEYGKLEVEMRAQEAEILAYMQEANKLSEEEIAKDPRTAFYMTQLFVRELLGPTKIIRFGSLKQAAISTQGVGGFKAANADKMSTGINVNAKIFRFGRRHYVPADMEATVSYQGQKWWKLERLNIPGKRGVLRFGIGMGMPTDKIEFSAGLFFKYRDRPVADVKPK